jgi:tetratricopeptide (TPR) repeat protein
MMRSVRLCLLVAIALSSRIPTTSAQPDPPEKVRALELFAQSDELYKQGQFEQAADLLREAYDLYPEPLLLYNLARALEGVGDVDGAITQYERYLATATTIDDRGAIERRVATLKAQRAAAQTVTTEPTPPTSPPIDTSPSTEPTSGPRKLPWIIAGGGALVAGTGVVFGFMAKSKHDAAVDEPVQAEAERLQNKAESYATISNVLLIGGGAIAIGGIVWGVIELRKSGHREPIVTAKPSSTPRVEIGPAYVGLRWDLP